MSLQGLVIDVIISAVTSALVSVVVVYLIMRCPHDEQTELLWSGKRERPRKRYLVFEAIASSEVKEDDVRAAVEEAFRRLFGEMGLAEAGLRLILYDPVRRRGIIRVRSGSLHQLLAALGVVRRISGADAMIVPLRTAGTIRKARKYVYQ
ncbi:MAG: Rpp14/Pop5 family protein [Acidilobus sp.]